MTSGEFIREIEEFSNFGKKTRKAEFAGAGFTIPVYINEFWTSRQRDAHSLHEISYRACFKPQLPNFFIKRLTAPGDTVYDPFMGRGTTLIEAALMGRRPFGCDVNPLGEILVRPRLNPPALNEVAERLAALELERQIETWSDLEVFYHPETLIQITNLREYFLSGEKKGTLDNVDTWIRMVATNRLTGHSGGFFSVYTLPPNQAVSIKSQKKINQKRGQKPPRRDVRSIILQKTRSLQRKLVEDERRTLRKMADESMILTGSSEYTPEIPDNSVALVVTSPPFLDVVDYRADNWLRCWFNGIDPGPVRIWRFRNPHEWQRAMTSVFRELNRVLIPGGFVAFEVGEVKNARLFLENLVVPAAREAGLLPELIMINEQVFTKTSKCWGIDNLKKGTNSNRIVLLRKV